MRTTIGIIHLVLRTNKVLASGESPIMLRCSYHGMKEVSTGYSCIPRYWDKKNECIKKGYPSYVTINYELKKLKDAAISKRDKYIASNEVYTPSMILDRSDMFNAVTNDLRGLIQRYIDNKGLEERTVEKWWATFRSLNGFVGREMLVNEIDESFCRRYARWLEDKGLKSGSVRTHLSKVGAICHYAISLGMLSCHPFEKWKYHRVYREGKNELYIHHRSMDVMIEMFIDMLVIRDGDGFRYRDNVLDELFDIHSFKYAVYLYVAGYVMKGLSPADMSFLWKSDVRMVEVKGISCYAIDGKRSKTGVGFKIRLRKDELINRLIIDTMLMFHQGEHLLPSIESYVGKSDRMSEKRRINNLYSYHTEHLVEWFKMVNSEIVRRNVENGDNIPTVDLECRYYSYRHSYIVKEIQKPNVNLLRIATETGKSVKTIHQYLTYLDDIDLID